MSEPFANECFHSLVGIFEILDADASLNMIERRNVL